ncbi:MAG: hypothetical protein ACE5H9_21255, partial [Anaerolineae bacterium]
MSVEISGRALSPAEVEDLRSPPPTVTSTLNYDLQHRYGSGQWETLLYGTSLTTWSYSGQEGTHTFRILARDGAFNESPLSAETSTVVDLTPPDLGLTITATPPYGYVLTDTVYYGQGSGSFTVTAIATDSVSGLAAITLPETTAPGAVYPQSGAL